MVWYRVNRPQRYIKILKEAIIEVIKLRTLRAKEPIVKEVKAKPKILVKQGLNHFNTLLVKNNSAQATYFITISSPSPLQIGRASCRERV